MNIVVGAGWSGIAAAVELADRGRPVTLIEAAAALGGRARRVEYHGRSLDNGQHLLTGACTAVRDLQRRIGLAETDLFERRRLVLMMHSPNRHPLRLEMAALPAPFHLAAGLLRASGLGLNDRLRALRLCHALRKPANLPDCSVAELFSRHRQSPRLIAGLWQPLCQAILNTPPEEASAEVFGRVLRDVFAGYRADSDLLFPRTDLGRLLPEPARRFIEGHGGRVLLRRRVTALEIAGNAIEAVICASGNRLPAQQVILALPPRAAARLLAPHPALAGLVRALQCFESAPIVTVYLEYPGNVALPYPLVGLEGGTAQWVFDQGTAGHPGRMAVVIGGHGSHLALDDETVVERVGADLAGCFPDWPPPTAGFVLREKRATFVCRTGINAQRPGIETPLTNCWLAGDAVATGYPATLEGAVRSGIACARRITGCEAAVADPGSASPAVASS